MYRIIVVFLLLLAIMVNSYGGGIGGDEFNVPVDFGNESSMTEYAVSNNDAQSNYLLTSGVITYKMLGIDGT